MSRSCTKTNRNGNHVLNHFAVWFLITFYICYRVTALDFGFFWETGRGIQKGRTKTEKARVLKGREGKNKWVLEGRINESLREEQMSHWGKNKWVIEGRTKWIIEGRTKKSHWGKNKMSPWGKNKWVLEGRTKKSHWGKKKVSHWGKNKWVVEGRKNESLRVENMSPWEKKKIRPWGKKQMSPWGKKNTHTHARKIDYEEQATAHTTPPYPRTQELQ